jgi:Ca-activated chloride channel family protein
MDFADPRFLVVFALALPLAVWLLERGERRRRADFAAFGERALLARVSHLPALRRGALSAGLVVLALGLGLLALARPQFGERSTPITRTARDVLVILDLSRSMNVRDVVPSRLEAAKAAIRTILAGTPDDRVGLVIFAGSAFLELPFTLDRSAFDFFLRSATTEDLADTGSDLAAAMTTAASAFGRATDPAYRVAVLVSDGENLEGSLGESVAQLRYAGVRVFAIGVGTPEGGPVPVPGGAVGAPAAPSAAPAYRRDENGAVVISRLREATLARIAAETGGGYVRYAGGPELGATVDAISRLGKRKVSGKSLTRLADRFQWPVALALAALVSDGLFAARRWRRGASEARGAEGGP